MVAAVPIMGSWNTRPMNLARLCSGSLVTFVPSMVTLPSSTLPHPRHRVEEGGLSRAVSADYRDKIAVVQGEGHAVEGCFFH